jgi:hypothetical protein
MMHADPIRIRGADASERRCSIKLDGYPNSMQLFLHMPGCILRAMICTCSPARSTLVVKRRAARSCDGSCSLAFFVIGWQRELGLHVSQRAHISMLYHPRSASCSCRHRVSVNLRMYECMREATICLAIPGVDPHGEL